MQVRTARGDRAYRTPSPERRPAERNGPEHALALDRALIVVLIVVVLTSGAQVFLGKADATETSLAMLAMFAGAAALVSEVKARWIRNRSRS